MECLEEKIKLNECAFDLIEGYHIEHFELPPYENKEVSLLLIIKNEDMDNEKHNEFVAKKKEQIENIEKHKWYMSEKERTDVGFVKAVIDFMEKSYNKDDSDEKEDVLEKYSFILKENHTTYLILRNDAETRFAIKEQRGLVNKLLGATEDKYMEWVERNAEKFRKVLEDCVIYRNKYIVLKNFEKRVDKEVVEDRLRDEL